MNALHVWPPKWKRTTEYRFYRGKYGTVLVPNKSKRPRLTRTRTENLFRWCFR